MLTLAPGREIAIAGTDSDPLPKVYADGMSRRNINIMKVGKFSAVSDEFSILNALSNHPLLRQVRHSDNVVDAKTIAANLRKWQQRINMVVDRYKGPYYARK